MFTVFYLNLVLYARSRFNDAGVILAVLLYASLFEGGESYRLWERGQCDNQPNHDDAREDRGQKNEQNGFDCPGITCDMSPGPDKAFKPGVEQGLEERFCRSLRRMGSWRVMLNPRL